MEGSPAIGHPGRVICATVLGYLHRVSKPLLTIVNETRSWDAVWSDAGRVKARGSDGVFLGVWACTSGRERQREPGTSKSGSRSARQRRAAGQEAGTRASGPPPSPAHGRGVRVMGEVMEAVEERVVASRRRREPRPQTHHRRRRCEALSHIVTYRV